MPCRNSTFLESYAHGWLPLTCIAAFVPYTKWVDAENRLDSWTLIHVKGTANLPPSAWSWLEVLAQDQGQIPANFNAALHEELKLKITHSNQKKAWRETCYLNISLDKAWRPGQNIVTRDLLRSTHWTKLGNYCILYFYSILWREYCRQDDIA